MADVRAIVAGMAGPWRRNLVIAGFLTAGSLAAGAAGPLVVRQALVGAEDATGAVALAAVGYLATAVAAGVVSGLLIDRMVVVGQEFLHRLRLAAMAAALRRPVPRARDSTGDLQSRVTNDVESLTDASVQLGPAVLTASLSIASGFLAVALLSPLGAVLALAVLPPTFVLSRWLARRGRVVYRAERERQADLTALLVESAEGAPTLRGLGAGPAWSERVRDGNARMVDAIRAGTRMRNRFYPGLTVVNGAVFAGVLLVVCLAALDGRTTTATAGAVLLALSGVFGPVTELAGQVDSVLSARASLTRVLELCATTTVTTGTDHPGAPRPARPAGAWSLDRLSFGYEPTRPVLFDVGLTVETEEHVALVGATGSGKSTLLRLAAGLVVAQAGAARLGGTDVARLRHPGDPAVLLFPQRSYAVHGSVLDNVRLWCPGAARDDVARAAAALGFAEWLSALPGGPDAPVGFGGSELTGADRQRLALVGLLLIEPRPAALDEPTSLLPTGEQPGVLAAIRRRFAGFPLLLASHHQQTARACDRVALLADGRLVDTGTHDELARRCPAYRGLWSDT